MRIKPAVATAIISLTLSASAQKKSSTFDVTATDPNKYRRSVLKIDPINFLQYGMTKFTPTLAVETFIGERIMPTAQLRYTVFDYPWHDRQWGNLEPVGGHKAPITAEVGASLFFIDRTKKKDVRVHTGRGMGSMGFGSRVYYYVKVPSEVKRMVGIRGGLNVARYMLAIDKEDVQFMYKYHPVGSTTEYQVGASGSAGGFYAMANTTSAYGGLHYRVVNNTKLEFYDGRRRSKAFVTDVFADVLYPFSSTISNVANQYDGEWVIKPKSMAINDFGWRAGLAIRPPKGRIVQGSIILGQRPGFLVANDANFYFLTNVGFCLGTDKYFGSKTRDVKGEKEGLNGL